MKRDPKVRQDGKCALKTCRKPRNPKRNPYSGIEPFLDPFCCSDCCREYHGAQLTTPPKPQPRRPHKWDDSSARRRARLARDGCPEGHKPSAANYRNGGRCDECREAYRVWQRKRRLKNRVAA